MVNTLEWGSLLVGGPKLPHSVHPPLSAGGGGGFEPPTKFFRGRSVGKAGWPFWGRGGCYFYIQNKLKSEIFNTKKSW